MCIVTELCGLEGYEKKVAGWAGRGELEGGSAGIVLYDYPVPTADDYCRRRGGERVHISTERIHKWTERIHKWTQLHPREYWLLLGDRVSINGPPPPLASTGFCSGIAACV